MGGRWGRVHWLRFRPLLGVGLVAGCVGQRTGTPVPDIPTLDRPDPERLYIERLGRTNTPLLSSVIPTCWRGNWEWTRLHFGG